MVRTNKNTHVFRMTQPYLNLLVKPRIFSGFLEIFHFMHFERRNAFQNASNYIFFKKYNFMHFERRNGFQYA